MEPEVAGSSSEDLMSDAYNFSRAEMVGDHMNSPDFQNFISYEDSNGNMMFVPNSAIKNENNLTCNNENLTELKNVKLEPTENDEKTASDIYLSTDIYIHPLSLNGNYENIIEFIDVDPNEKLDGSPLLKNEDCKTKDVLDNQHYDVAFGCFVPYKNGVVPFFHNYANIPVNSDLQSLQVIYNTPSTSSSSPPEDVNLNHFALKETKKTVPPFLRRNRKPKSAAAQIKPESTESETNYNDEDDDVIFVKEWELSAKLKKPHLNNLNPKQVASTKTANINDTNVEATTSSSSSPTSSVRGRKKRTFGEKRKNPVRKAQIEKASMDLAEKLAIPPSVFNARVKGRKPKQKIIYETKNLRQSCRTSGAILSPPRTLTQCDYKEWPVDGMHERPFYDQSTNTIIKYHLPNNNAVKNEQGNDRRPVLSELSQDVDSKTLPKSDSSFQVSTKRKPFKRSQTNNIQHSKKFAKIALDRLQMMFGYVQELKEFNRLVVAGTSSNQENQLSVRKPTLYEKSLEFRLYQNGIKEKKLVNSLSTILKGCKEENIKNMETMLHDTCSLYSLASGATSQNVADIVNNYAAKGKNWVRPQI